MADVSPQMAHALPPGTVSPIGAQYGHVITAEDLFVSIITGGTPLCAADFANQTGISEPMPLNPMWGEWARRVRIDLPVVRAYAHAVYAATDAMLAAMTEQDLGRDVKLPIAGAGSATIRQLLGNLLLNAYSHAGEISCLKGLLGQRGYPS